MSRSAKAHILLVLVTLVWGATFVQIKAALYYATPLLFNVVRMCLAAAALCILFRKQLARLTPGAARAGTVVGFFLWLGYEFQTPGLRITSASKSAFLTGISVVLVPVFLALFFRRHIQRWTIVGVTSALVGLYLLTVPATASGASDFSSINRGDLLTLGCAVSFAFQIIFMGRATRKYPFQQVAAVEAVVCALLMAITVPVLEKPEVIWNSTVIWAILVTGLLGTAAAFTVQAWAQQFTPPTHTALIFSLEPVFAWLTSLIVLKETLGMRAGLGGALVLTGVLVSELKGSTGTAASEETGSEAESGAAAYDKTATVNSETRSGGQL